MSDEARPQGFILNSPQQFSFIPVDVRGRLDGQKLLTLEAMKMESTINAEIDGKIGQVLIHAGTQVDTGDLLLTIE